MLLIFAGVILIPLGASSIRFWWQGLSWTIAMAVALTGLSTMLALARVGEDGLVDWSRMWSAALANLIICLACYGIGATVNLVSRRISHHD